MCDVDVYIWVEKGIQVKYAVKHCLKHTIAYRCCTKYMLFIINMFGCRNWKQWHLRIPFLYTTHQHICD